MGESVTESDNCQLSFPGVRTKVRGGGDRGRERLASLSALLFPSINACVNFPYFLREGVINLALFSAFSLR